ncbi:MAG: ParB/RepB/Spo0J family partition protein [Christensenellales bacterium]|jgi:ParB family chromosome partitioning protein
MQKRGLGRGLGALIGDEKLQPAPPSAQPREIGINRLDPNTSQPRRRFDEQALETLAESIREHGVVQPIVVRQSGDRFTIIAGERRWRAARLAGLSTVPVVLREADERSMMELALVENIQRQDLNPMEEAGAVNALIQEYGLTQAEVARRIGRSRSAVTNLLRLRTLAPQVQQMLREELLTEGQARPLAVLPFDTQEKLAREIVKNGLSARTAEQLAAGAQQKSEKRRAEATPVPEITMLEDTIRNAMGVKVTVRGNLSRGSITLSYQSREDLERIYEGFNQLNGEN